MSASSQRFKCFGDPRGWVHDQSETWDLNPGKNATIPPAEKPARLRGRHVPGSRGSPWGQKPTHLPDDSQCLGARSSPAPHAPALRAGKALHKMPRADLLQLGVSLPTLRGLGLPPPLLPRAWVSLHKPGSTPLGSPTLPQAGVSLPGPRFLSRPGRGLLARPWVPLSQRPGSPLELKASCSLPAWTTDRLRAPTPRS